MSESLPSPPRGKDAVARARACVLDAFSRAMLNCDRRQRAALRAGFIADFNARKLAFEDDVYAAIDRLSAPTLKRWLKTLKDEGEKGLAPRYGAAIKIGAIDRYPDVSEYLTAQIAARPHISSAILMAGLRAAFDDGRRLPSYRALQRWVKRYREDNARDLLAIADPDAYRSKFTIAAGSRSEGVVRPNQLWELDSTIADVSLVDPETGKPKRFALVQCIDVATRRMKMLVARTSTSAAIAALLRRALLDWGVPERVKTDNGQDYTSRGIDLLFLNLEIARELCPPFTPEAKPHVERAFKTFLHNIVEGLPGYVGHNVGERKGIESRRAFSQRLGERNAAIEVSLSPDDFQKICDQWADDLYAHRVHKSLGRSPFAEAAAYEGERTHISDERALDILLLPASGKNATRVVGKKGIAILGGHYTDALLGAMVGKTVRVLTDPADLGHVFVFSLDNYFLCEAVNHIRRGVSAAEVAARAKAVQREVINQSKAEMRAAMRRVNTDDLVASILRRAAENSANVVAPDFRGSREHTTPALAEAGKAARVGDFAMRDDTDAERKAKEKIAADLRAGRAPAPSRAGRVIEFTMREDTPEESAMKAKVAASLKQIGEDRRR